MNVRAVVLTALTVIVGFALSVFLAGCPRPIPVPPAPPPADGFSYCDFGDAGSSPTNADRCPGQWRPAGASAGGYPCVRCAVSGCVDRTFQVFCVSSCAQCQLAP